VNDRKEIIQIRRYFINDGRITETFTCRTAWRPGNYFLRAYTNWMRNYGEEFYYVKPVRILTLFETVVGPAGPPLPKTFGASIVKITSDRSQYKTREKVSLAINVKEEDDDSGPLYFNFCSRCKAIDRFWGETIERTRNDFKDAPDTYLRPVHPIEKGISIRGVFGTTRQR